MKGTVARGINDAQDFRNKDWLANDSKNRSENMMIVDLLRNDMGRISESGSVTVSKLCEIEQYSTVWQMTSTIESQLISSVDDLEGKTLIVGKGTTAETYFKKNYPKVNLLKYDQYSEAYQALLDGRGDALSTDNTEVLAWALENKGYEVGITSLGDTDTIAPAVQKGNTALLDWINNEIKTLGEENFFHRAYEETLEPVYGDAANPDDLVVEGGNVD